MKGTHFLPAMPCIRMASALKLYAFDLQVADQTPSPRLPKAAGGFSLSTGSPHAHSALSARDALYLDGWRSQGRDSASPPFVLDGPCAGSAWWASMGGFHPRAVVQRHADVPQTDQASPDHSLGRRSNQPEQHIFENRTPLFLRPSPKLTELLPGLRKIHAGADE